MSSMDDEAFPSTVADALLAGKPPIKVFREYRGMSIDDLASICGFGPSDRLAAIESGTTKATDEELQKIASALKLEVDDLI